MKSKALLLVLFLLAVSLRLVLFYTVWSDLRHGSATVYGSVAIGLFHDRGLTYNESEISRIKQEPSNHSGDFPEYYEKTNRQTFVEFLPGPAVLLFSLWKAIPVRNFAPYIWLQIILDSLLIVLFYLALRDHDRSIVLIATLLMILNLATIKRTLMMGYDFWPQFVVLVNFIGISFFLKERKSYLALFAAGALTSFAIWFRAITTLLPFFIAILLVLCLRLKYKEGFSRILSSLVLYLLPVLISLSLLSTFRYELTGNFRPTRSTFWTMFIGGVFQFSNPYGLKCTDRNIEEFARAANEEIGDQSHILGGEVPNSLFETTLKKQAYSFITMYPHLVARNTVYRIGIMLSPVFYRDYDFVPRRLASLSFPLGLPLLLLWLGGMNYLLRYEKHLFWLSLTVYLYFVVTFSWVYVAGRVILPFLFLNILVYLFGLKHLGWTISEIRGRKRS